VLLRNGQSTHGITALGLAWLRDQLVAAGDLRKVSLPGLREDRVPVLAGGVAIMSGIFAELDVREMTVAEGALRQGVLWDLLGRVHHRDIRDVTVEQFAKRYHVDAVQAQRVCSLSQSLLRDLAREDRDLEALAPFLDWACRLHEVGISIAQGAYHKHSAYILANADMPGFSRQEQARLSTLVLAQRGGLAKMRGEFEADPLMAELALCLRLAVIFYRARRTLRLPAVRASRRGRIFRIEIDAAWLAERSLIALALDAERAQWSSVGLALELA